MKKVGIITFHFADNFGAVLQAFALSKTIKDMGYNVEIINFIPTQLREYYDVYFNIRRSITHKGLKTTIKQILLRILRYNEYKKRTKEFQKFRDNFLYVSKKKYIESSKIKEDKPKYDYYITGSDQVWNPYFFKRVGETYFLDFAKEGSRKIAYAVSIAKDKVDDIDIKIYEQHLKDFDYISVREKSARTFLKKLTKKDIYVTLDPTFLIDKDEWCKIFANENKKERYILVYDLVKNTTIVSLANKVAKKLGCKIISYSNKKGYKNWFKSFRSASPTEFLSLCLKSEFIITSSFHGTAFAIIFNRPFYTIPHPTTGSRMIDLLNDLGLSDRIIKDVNQPKIINKDIDFNKVNLSISKLRKQSIDFLKTALDYKSKN